MTKRKRIILTRVFILVVLLSVFIYSKIRKSYIENDYAYVIGKVYSSEPDADGISYKFYYYFNDKKYMHGIAGLSLHTQNDLILLKISRKNPDFWLHIEIDLPECIISNPNFDSSWSTIPTCEK